MKMDCLGASLAVSSRSCSSSSAVNSNNVVVGGGGGGGGGGSNITTTTVAGLPPFHYLISEQAKSILALQELQNEVGALLEFRDLVMETFPHLRQKISVPSSSSALSSTLLPSNSAPSSTNATTRWEPGIRVKRKLGQQQQQQRDPEPLVPSLGHRCRSNSHGKSTKSSSGEAASSSSTSTNASSAVQDSGFCAESSKDHSANSSNNSGRKINKEDIDEDDLCSLLDMIHQQGTRLRLEVEYLRSRLNGNIIYSPLDKEWRRCRSVDDLLFISRLENDRTISSAGRGGATGGSSSNIGTSSSAIACISSGIGSSSYQQHPIRRRLRLLEAAVEDLRKERTILLNRIAEMESEHEANLAHTNQLISEMEMINAQKQRLQEEMQMAVAGRSELNQRIHQLYCKLTARNNQNRPANNAVVGHQCSTGSSSLLSPSPSSALTKQLPLAPAAQPTLTCSSQNLLLYDNSNCNNDISNSGDTRHSVVNSSSAVATDIADSSQALHPSCCSKQSYFTPICYSSANKDRGGAHRSSPDDYFRVLDNDGPPVMAKESANSNVLMMSSIELDDEQSNCVLGENDKGNKLMITAAMMSPICLQHSNNTRPSNPLSKKLNDGVESGQVVTVTDQSASPPINLLSKPNIIRFQRRSVSSGKQLGALDGIVSNPSTLMKIPKGAALATNTLTAILTQLNPIELQRHLITCAYQNETLVFQMERISKSRLKVIKQLHKFKEQNYDLKFQVNKFIIA